MDELIGAGVRKAEVETVTREKIRAANFMVRFLLGRLTEKR